MGSVSTRIVVGNSGASGAVYGVRLLQVPGELDGVETHAVVTRRAVTTLDHEYCLAASENMDDPTSAFQRPPADREVTNGDVLLIELGARDGHGSEARCVNHLEPKVYQP